MRATDEARNSNQSGAPQLRARLDGTPVSKAAPQFNPGKKSTQKGGAYNSKNLTPMRNQGQRRSLVRE